ncbi:MAG: hypothetical protein WCS65_14375 [Verrucomicrobiae bacterium]
MHATIFRPFTFAALFALVLAVPAIHARQAAGAGDAGSASTFGSSGMITPEEAVRIIAKKLGRPLGKQNHLVFDRTEDRSGRSYHVVHGYEVVIDDPKTGEGHTATWGWFFVDRKDGAAYIWDLAEDQLVRF